MHEVKVKAVTMDEAGEFQVLLTDMEERNILPIHIGPFEAQAIVMALQNKMPPRPMSHDLLKSLCSSLNGTLEKVVITDIREDTFYAEIYLNYNEQTYVVDSRPSDAIALALRCNSSIFMGLKLIEFTYDYDDIIKEDPPDEDVH
ncbi:MAG: bifunctional nuclease family protein [Candidatus Syntrophonatronum acetioxidans]|uniref:Bifunctional nuclease family protein n=1 Tax=Candidatus Syntrophonatronum acetioxidans TaxID=1795816 RepID=A0A424YI17_9FIRM|nr:MAG: bifunctional nuclease family protein [Candidatus Syntrophonatronum acetioxidans]